MTNCMYEHEGHHYPATVLSWVGQLDCVRAVVRDSSTRKCLVVSPDQITFLPHESELSPGTAAAREKITQPQMDEIVARMHRAAMPNPETIRHRLYAGLVRLNQVGMATSTEGANWLYEYAMLGYELDPPAPF